MKTRIRAMKPEDWPAVRSVYLEGIGTGEATFETAAPTWEQWDSDHFSSARLVATDENDGEIKGWAALSPVSRRQAYSGVAEVSVYVAEPSRRQGVGKALLKQLIMESEQMGLWTLQASVFPENSASVELHKSLGFREVGIRERIGKLGGVWRNTMLLERRSRSTS